MNKDFWINVVRNKKVIKMRAPKKIIRRRKSTMRAPRGVKISVPYVAFSIGHDALSSGQLSVFNTYINSMDRYCTCERALTCGVGEIGQGNPPTRNMSQWLIIFVKQTDVDGKILQDARLLNDMVSDPRKIIGHAVVEMVDRSVWNKDFTGASNARIISILSLCKHIGLGVASRIGYERVMLNALLRWADRQCINHYQWIAINYRRDDYLSIVKLLTDYGFKYPYATTLNLNGERFNDTVIAMFKKDTHLGINDSKNRAHYARAIEIANRLTGRSNSFKFSFDEKTLNNLRLMPFFVTTANQGTPGRACNPTTPLTLNEITTIMEYGGKFDIKDATAAEDGSVTFILTMKTPPKGFYSYNVGNEESISDVPKGSVNFHTHPYTTLYTRFRQGGMSFPSASDLTPHFIPQGTKIISSYPSPADFQFVYYHTVMEKMNPLQIHLVVEPQGIWTISVKRHAANPDAPISDIASKFNFSLAENGLRDNLVGPDEPFTGYSGSEVEEGRVQRAIRAFINLFNQRNAMYGDIFDLQFYSWSELSSGKQIVSGEETMGFSGINYQFNASAGGVQSGYPLVFVEDFRKIARLNPYINSGDLYSLDKSSPMEVEY
jgi:hypothetical protein